MTVFEDELRNGNFVVGDCSNCKNIVWPPNDYCNNCFSHVTWRKITPNGKLLEFSKKDEIIFGIVELEEKIRVVGRLDINSKDIRNGQFVKLASCNYENGPKFTFVSCNDSY